MRTLRHDDRCHPAQTFKFNVVVTNGAMISNHGQTDVCTNHTSQITKVNERSILILREVQFHDAILAMMNTTDIIPQMSNTEQSQLLSSLARLSTGKLESKSHQLLRIYYPWMKI
jgi:hypothetical protein